jgi:hypothetical protein
MMIADLLSMVDKITEYVAATEDWKQQLDLGMVGTIFMMVREHMKGGHFTREDIRILIQGFYWIIAQNEEELGRSVKDFNQIVRPYGIDSSIIRSHLVTSPRDKALANIFEMIRMPAGS